MKKKILFILFLFIFIGTVNAKTCIYENKVGVEMDCNLYNSLKEYYTENFLDYMPQNEYNQIKNNNPEDIEVETITPIRGSYYGTTYKEIRIVRNGSFITVSLVWLNNPVTRSYEVFAIRLTSGVSINGSVNFRQYSDNNGNGIVSTNCSKKTFSNGVGVSFKLSVYNNLESYITFNYTGSGTIYSSYQHAITGVTLTQSKKYTLSSSGYGGTTLFDNSVSGYYDGMSGVNLSV